jgi:hypothetical protein
LSIVVTAKSAAVARTAIAAAFIGLAGIGGISCASVALAGPAAATVDHGTLTSTGMFGDPAAAAPYWHEQQYDDCALMAVAEVVGQITGHEPTEQEIITVAEHTLSKSHPGSIYMEPSDPKDPNNTGMGTDPADIVVLLAHYGIHATTSDGENGARADTGIDALKLALAAGQAVIVGVNGETIWNSSDGQRKVADHALVVIGIDAKNGIVHLNDSGSPDGRDEQVPMSTFMKAWKASGYEMTATEETVR